jgi:hypothetical protein
MTSTYKICFFNEVVPVTEVICRTIAWGTKGDEAVFSILNEYSGIHSGLRKPRCLARVTIRSLSNVRLSYLIIHSEWHIQVHRGFNKAFPIAVRQACRRFSRHVDGQIGHLFCDCQHLNKRSLCCSATYKVSRCCNKLHMPLESRLLAASHSSKP